MAPKRDRPEVHRGTVEPERASGDRERLPVPKDSAWQFPPLEPPRADPELERLGPLGRAAEVLRYSLLRLEHALSPDGALRRWLKRVLRAGAFLAIPLAVLLPLALLLLGGIAACVRRLHEIALHAFLSGLVIGLVLLAVVIVLRLGGIGRR